MRISDWSSDVCSSDLICSRNWGDFPFFLIAIVIAPSPPARRRGSKPWLGKVAAGVWLSPPARRRGSKPRERHGERGRAGRLLRGGVDRNIFGRSEEHTSELQSLMRLSFAVCCLKKKKTNQPRHINPTCSRLTNIQHSTSQQIHHHRRA